MMVVVTIWKVYVGSLTNRKYVPLCSSLLLRTIDHCIVHTISLNDTEKFCPMAHILHSDRYYVALNIFTPTYADRQKHFD